MPVVDVHVDHYKTKESIVRRGRYYDGNAQLVMRRVSAQPLVAMLSYYCVQFVSGVSSPQRHAQRIFSCSTGIADQLASCGSYLHIVELGGVCPSASQLCFKNFSFSSSHFYSLRLLFFELLNSISANKR
uniref:Uncharacterized protein n=1 Tax=Ascaris lumbricoides TaxID=6252 RepID=A0A0M3I4L3_ASCLU